MNLTDVKHVPIRRKRKFPIGRGKGSGLGKTGGRGGKGQYARTGVSKYPHWEGGQTPLVRKIPKRGFSNFPFAHRVAEVNLGELEAFNAGDVVDPEKLRAAGLVGREAQYVKILGDGELKKALTIKAHAISAAAAEKAKKAGATVEILPSDLAERLAWRAKLDARMRAKAEEKEKARLARKEERAKARADKAARRAAGEKPETKKPKEKEKAPKAKKPEGKHAPPKKEEKGS